MQRAFAAARAALAAAPADAPPIVVLARGAHVDVGGGIDHLARDAPGADGVLQPLGAINAAHLARIAAAIAWVRAAAPHARVFYRTSHTAQPACAALTHAPPLAGAPPPYVEPPGEAGDGFEWRPWYRWGNVVAQNAAAVAALPPDVDVLDVARPTNLRRDSHPIFRYGRTARQDCLHFCLPGPPDFWVELLLAILRVDAGEVWDGGDGAGPAAAR